MEPAHSKSGFRVTIHYCEPGYARMRDQFSKPYCWTFAVRATTGESAKQRALSEFGRIAELSCVNWSREVERVDCVRMRELRPSSMVLIAD